MVYLRCKVSTYYYQACLFNTILVPNIIAADFEILNLTSEMCSSHFNLSCSVAIRNVVVHTLLDVLFYGYNNVITFQFPTIE